MTTSTHENETPPIASSPSQIELEKRQNSLDGTLEVLEQKLKEAVAVVEKARAQASQDKS
jgi:hypothetical protein